MIPPVDRVGPRNHVSWFSCLGLCLKHSLLALKLTSSSSQISEVLAEESSARAGPFRSVPLHQMALSSAASWCPLLPHTVLISS